MAHRTILQEGDPTLTKMSRAITAFDDRLHILLDDMKETMSHANGVGLAAPQVGVLRRAALVLDIDMDEDGEIRETLLELINPEIVETKGEQVSYEGCLSVPGLLGEVARPQWVKVKAQDRHGEWIEVEGIGLTARALCHEIDHLDGLLFTRLTKELIRADQLEEA